MRTGVVGASGYAGSEVLRLAATHPDLEVVVATGASTAGRRVADHVPALAAAYPELELSGVDAVNPDALDVVFVALPHGESQGLVPRMVAAGVTAVDLGADFRLRDAADVRPVVRGSARGARAPVPVRLRVGRAAPGRPRGRDADRGPGLLPDRDVASARSVPRRAGSSRTRASSSTRSAAPRAPGAQTSERLHYSRLAANAEAYGLLTHRHTPEIEQEIGAEVLFTPAPHTGEPRTTGHGLRAGRSVGASRPPTRWHCCATPTAPTRSSWSATSRPA